LDKETIIRTILAVAIIMGLMVAWKTWIAPPPEPRPPAPAEGPEKPPAEGPEKPPAEGPEKPPAEGPEKPPAVGPPAAAETWEMRAVGAETPGEPVILGSDAPISPYDLEAEIHPQGAAVARLTLARKRFFKTVADRDLPAAERRAMDLIEPDVPEPALAVEEFRLRLEDKEGWGRVDLSQVPWRVETEGEEGLKSSAVFSVDVTDADGTPLAAVRKEVRLLRRGTPGGEVEGADAPQYEFRMTVEMTALDDRVTEGYYALHGPPALPREGQRTDMRGAVFGLWEGRRIAVTTASGTAAEKEDVPRIGPTMAWLGQADKYFAVLVVPLVAGAGGGYVMPESPPEGGTFAAGAEVDARKVTEGRDELPLPIVRMESKAVPLEKGKAVRHEFGVFAGPKDPDLLETSYRYIGFDQLIVWTRCCIPIPGLTYISRGLLAVIEAFHSLVGNWGVAIIMLVIALRVVLLPVSKWSAKSMAEMQKMAPRMQEIREKYGDDKQKMQQEMAKIGGFKAMGGCLPMFLQMPVWIGLYGALQVAIQLRHSGFLPAEWIPAGSLFLQDLSAPDMLLHWSNPVYLPGLDIPLLGTLIGGIQNMLSGGGGITSVNVLPVLVGLAIYFQQKLMPMSSAAAANPDAQKQQQMMMKIMPVFLAVVLYSAPSGLTLYIGTSTVLGFLENRFFRHRWIEAAKAKTESPEPTGPAAPAKQKSLVTGRRKSLSERAEAWVRRKLDQQKKNGKRKK